MGIALNIARAAYRCPRIKKRFDCVAELCGKVADYRTAKKEPLLPKNNRGRIKLIIKLILSNNPYWNNPLMQLVYREIPDSEETLAIMSFLTVAEPTKDGFLKEFSSIKAGSQEAIKIFDELDAKVASDPMFTCKGITTFRNLFEGRFGSGVAKTGGFVHFIGGSIQVYIGGEDFKRSMPEAYADSMQFAAKCLKAAELLSHSLKI